MNDLIYLEKEIETMYRYLNRFISKSQDILIKNKYLDDLRKINSKQVKIIANIFIDIENKLYEKGEM